MKTTVAPFPEPPVDGEGRTSDLLVSGILVFVAIGGAADLMMDRPATFWSPHVLFEVLLMVTSLGFAVFLWSGWRRATRSLRRTAQSLQEQIVERDAWRESARVALEGMALAIDRQFTAWQLTPAEREVALLLLKGYGHKQAAARTGRSERTVRQHAVSVYEKAGLGGRAELAAFFLEGLLVPGLPGERTP